jgi:hypothetical protein
MAETAMTFSGAVAEMSMAIAGSTESGRGIILKAVRVTI